VNEGPDIPLIKRQIETQLDEYERAIVEAAAFMEVWRARRLVEKAAAE
jgi:hypothetical protein